MSNLIPRIDRLILSHKVREKSSLSPEEFDQQMEAIYEGFDGMDSISDFQLETKLLTYFKEFDQFIIERHRNNPPTFNGKVDLNNPRGIEWIKTPHTDSDDQGFEGSWIHDKDDNIIFYRNIIDCNAELYNEEHPEVNEN